MVTVVIGSDNPLDAKPSNLYTGIVTEKGLKYIKVAFDTEACPDAGDGPFRCTAAAAASNLLLSRWPL